MLLIRNHLGHHHASKRTATPLVDMKGIEEILTRKEVPGKNQLGRRADVCIRDDFSHLSNQLGPKSSLFKFLGYPRHDDRVMQNAMIRTKLRDPPQRLGLRVREPVMLPDEIAVSCEMPQSVQPPFHRALGSDSEIIPGVPAKVKSG